MIHLFYSFLHCFVFSIRRFVIINIRLSVPFLLVYSSSSLFCFFYFFLLPLCPSTLFLPKLFLVTLFGEGAPSLPSARRIHSSRRFCCHRKAVNLPPPSLFVACLPSPIPAGRSFPQRPPSCKVRCAIHCASPSLPNTTLRSCGCKGAPFGFWLLPLRSLQKIAEAIR
jgi:hypothetical protein